MIKEGKDTAQRIFYQGERIYGMFIGKTPIFLTYLIIEPTEIDINDYHKIADVKIRSNTEWYI